MHDHSVGPRFQHPTGADVLRHSLVGRLSVLSGGGGGYAHLPTSMVAWLSIVGLANDEGEAGLRDTVPSGNGLLRYATSFVRIRMRPVSVVQRVAKDAVERHRWRHATRHLDAVKTRTVTGAVPCDAYAQQNVR